MKANSTPQNGNNYESRYDKAVHSNPAEPKMNILSLTKTFHKINHNDTSSFIYFSLNQNLPLFILRKSEKRQLAISLPVIAAAVGCAKRSTHPRRFLCDSVASTHVRMVALVVPSITIGEARDRHLILNNPWLYCDIDFIKMMCYLSHLSEKV